MLAIRMQRTGRSGHANFRVVVQDSRQTPTSGKVIAQIGTYDPHTKTATLAKDKAEFYLTHGAHPSDRVAKLLKQEGVKLPKWVELSSKKEGKLRNPDKLRKNRPAEAAPAAETAEASEAPAAEPVTEAVAPAEEIPAETSQAPVEPAEAAAEETAPAETEAPVAEPEATPAAEEAADEAEKPAE